MRLHLARSVGGQMSVVWSRLFDAQAVMKKPSGPVTYKIENGADVWPTGRNWRTGTMLLSIAAVAGLLLLALYAARS